jgi:polar amino acid transport system ATP-binding protein
MPFAAEVADQVIFMADGVIVEEGPPRRLLYNPTHERTQRFLAEVFK